MPRASRVYWSWWFLSRWVCSPTMVVVLAGDMRVAYFVAPSSSGFFPLVNGAQMSPKHSVHCKIEVAVENEPIHLPERCTSAGQRTDRRTRTVNRPVRGACGRGRGRHRGRSSPAMPPLWRPHDDCRKLRAQWRTSRSATLSWARHRDPMTPLTASRSLSPAGEHRLRQCIVFAPLSPRALLIPSIAVTSPPRRPPRRPVHHRHWRSDPLYAGQRIPCSSCCPAKSP